MAEAVLAVVMAAGPQVDPIQVGPKTHNSPVSLYQGRHYVERHNRKRICVRHRESKHDYRAVSKSGRYRGAYQFSPALARGAAWMIQAELRATGTPKREAIRIGRELRAHPMNQWAPFFQDLAFWLVWDQGEGRSHWRATVPGTSCW
jgi:hypothetical protein